MKELRKTESAPKARKTNGEKRVRRRSRVQKLAARPLIAKADCLTRRKQMSDLGLPISKPPVPSENRDTMRLCVDYVAAGRFFQSGAEVPLQLLPPAVRKYAEGGSEDLEPEPAAVKLARRSFKRRKGVR